MVAPRLPPGSVLRWQRARIRIGCEGYSFSTILNYPARSEDMSALDGRIALVTGSSRGIGAAIAKRFASAGARVAVHGRDRAALDEVRGAIARSGGSAIQVEADVTRLEEIEAMRALLILRGR
jgi:3-oxoacyl-ACP reductase-like protein